MKKISIYSFVFLILHSCGNKIEKTIDGVWSMDTIYFNNYDIKNCLIGNCLELRFDKKSIFPVAENYCSPIVTNNFDKTAKIVLHKIEGDTIPYRIEIISDNKIFAGTHRVVFHKDLTNELLKMEIWSDSLYIICRKGLFNLNANIDLVNNLEDESWTTRPH